MKVVTLFGTRPEIIRLSRVIETLDRFCDQTLVHTGQNHDPNLSDIFFDDLKLRKPDVHLGVKGTDFGTQAGEILARTADVLREVAPDRFLVLGDTNSALAAIVAARMRVPVYHMEAGNRCYDDRVPEEINRRLIDHASDVLMPYTERSRANLLREGFASDRIFVIGNPIFEVLRAHEEAIARSDVLARLGLEPQQYFLATMHRAENVDEPSRLGRLLEGLAAVADAYDLPLILSLHPRTADRMTRMGLRAPSPRIRITKPLGLFDFVHLEKHARAVLSDSGTTQEECCIFRVPNVTIRDVTERPETVETSSNILTGSDPADILRAVQIAVGTAHAWTIPSEYLAPQVSTTVAKIVLGYGGARR